MKIVEEHICDFNGQYIPAHHQPKEDGYYMTVRCGLNGVYTCLDEWKNNDWQIGILDDSRVVAYSREKISQEDVEAWCKEKLEKYKNK